MAEPAIRHEIELGRQRLTAADRLWIGGCYAEGLRLHVSSMRSTLEALRVHAPSVAIDAPDDEELASLPDLDADVGPRERALQARVRRSQEQAIAALVGALPVDPRKRANRFRLAIASLATLAVIAAIVTWRWPTLSASATAAYGSANLPRKAIDGEVLTEWWLPDGVKGSLEIRLSPPRAVRRVRLLNIQDPGQLERGTAKYVLHVIDRGVEVRTAPGDLPRAALQAWQSVPIDVARADLIRVEVVEFHGKGGGFAEVEVE